jgi:putative MATE family efflux protein
MNQKNSEKLGKTDVHKLLIQLTIPAMIGMLVNALYNLTDTIFVGRGVGELAIGALSLAAPVQTLIMAVGLMIGIGGASVFSRAYGRGDKETMDHTINTALRADVILALALTIAGFIFVEDLLRFFKATPSNIGYAKDYLSIIFIGLVPLTLSMVLNNFTRAEGRVKVAMISMVIGAGLNIILDPIFIFDWGLGLGVKGAAMATVTSQIIAFLYILRMSFAKDSVLDIHFKGLLSIDFTVLKETLLVGLPTFIRNSMAAFLTIFIFFILEFYATGDHAIYQSIYGVVNRLILFIFMPAFGLVQGLAPIAGYNYGAKNYKRLEDVIKFATKLLLIYFTIAFIIIQVFASNLFGIFTNETSGFFIEYGSYVLRTISIGFILIVFQIVMSSVYQSFGYAKRAMFVALSRQLILFVPFVIILTNIYGLDGLWYTFFTADIIAGIIAIAMFIYEMKVLRKKHQIT